MHTAILRRATALVLAAACAPAAAQSPACLSPDPAEWPAPSRPYVLVIADTSGSMTSAVAGTASACGYGSDRRAHLRCALRNVFQAWAGRVSFGLATFPRQQYSCGATCATCLYGDYPGNLTNPGCGRGTEASRGGLMIRVPVQQDPFWTAPPPPSSVASLAGWVDGSCASQAELFADGFTPLNGALRDARRYFATSWTAPDSSVTYVSPLASQDLAGAGVNGSSACRPVRVIFVADGGETCDAIGSAVAAAQDLYVNGVTVGGKTFKIPVHVVNLGAGAMAEFDAIASAGGTGAALPAANEVELQQALHGILSGLVAPETCDNRDDDCNGCVDEGFPRWANVGQTCCAWASETERNVCLAQYAGTVGPGAPQGNRTLLPCATDAQADAPATWLCVNPGDVCDDADNNGDGVVDEGHPRCGSPLHCPAAEVCNGLDDDCDGQIDEEGVCGTCVPSSESCDGCDNDCDGVADDGVGETVPCGFTGPGEPPWCAGTRTCMAPVPVPMGTCAANRGFTACSSTPQAELCNALDDDCDGVVDGGVAQHSCAPPGAPSGLFYGGSARCQMGTSRCVNGATSCEGWVGPSAEVCDGIDDDCDGTVDDGVPGAGMACGIADPPCRSGVTACIGGALVCQGGLQPQPEVCDGVDNDCNGTVDDGALADGPAPGQGGCWSGVGACCSFPAASPTVTWCPPVGATCDGLGALEDACRAGWLVCAGGAWACTGERGPATETCNGLDDDCDGEVDEAVQGAGSACRAAEGACTAGVLECTPAGMRCSGVGPSVERCDGTDDDCNGLIDDGIDCGASACALVTCPADARCVEREGGAACVKTDRSRSGGCGCGGGPASGAAIPALLLAALRAIRRRRSPPRPPAVGLGAAVLLAVLAATGCGSSTTTREVDVAPHAAPGCTPADSGPERCDGVDDDCNGLVDDVTPAGEPSLGTTCSGGPQGACADPAHAGTLACRGGRLVCSGPAVLRPFQQPETCNGADDDCDGAVDDDPVDVGTACGASDVAPCRRGRTSCQGGVLGCNAVEPTAETCNGIDDDCDGVVDDHLPAAEAGAACGGRPAPPPGATSPCHAGAMACQGGVSTCVGATGPPSTSDACGVDADCDGTLTNQPDLQTDLHNCGACGNDCDAGAVHARWGCVSGACQFQGCRPGYHDNGGPGDAAAGDQRCGYGCSFVSARETCNGQDDNCDGQVDEAASLVVPSPVQACGVSPAATAPECSAWDVSTNPGGVTLACVAGAWQCTFHTARVCSPTCAAAAEVCDALDNDCDGRSNENVPEYGRPCASDDGLPLRHGPCRTTGTRVCVGDASTRCSVEKDLSQAGPELCNGIDDDCDGVADETYDAPGLAPSFVRPVVTRIAASLWIHSYEASRPGATATTAGSGNGYWLAAPAGATLDRTRACSLAGRLPWFGVTPAEVEQTCEALGGRICTAAEWVAACRPDTPAATCSYGYAPRGAAGSACATGYVPGSKYCNLGPSYDLDPATAGDQDGLLPAASGDLASCWADWSGLQGNTASTSRVHDLTGNLRELVTNGAGHGAVGGSFLTMDEQGARCGSAVEPVGAFSAARDAGFRCCFDQNPSP